MILFLVITFFLGNCFAFNPFEFKKALNGFIELQDSEFEEQPPCENGQSLDEENIEVETQIDCYTNENSKIDEELEITSIKEIQIPYKTKYADSRKYEAKAYEYLERVQHTQDPFIKELLIRKAKEYTDLAVKIESIYDQYKSPDARKMMIKAYGKLDDLRAFNSKTNKFGANVLVKSIRNSFQEAAKWEEAYERYPEDKATSYMYKVLGIKESLQSYSDKQRVKRLEQIKKLSQKAEAVHRAFSDFDNKQSQKLAVDALTLEIKSQEIKSAIKSKKLSELAMYKRSVARAHQEAKENFKYKKSQKQYLGSQKSLARIKYNVEVGQTLMEEGSSTSALNYNANNLYHKNKAKYQRANSIKTDERKLEREFTPEFYIYGFQTGDYAEMTNKNDNILIGAYGLMGLNDGNDQQFSHGMDFELGSSSVIKNSGLNVRIKQEGEQYNINPSFDHFITSDGNTVFIEKDSPVYVNEEDKNSSAYIVDVDGNTHDVNDIEKERDDDYRYYVFREIKRTRISIDTYKPNAQTFAKLTLDHIKYNSSQDPNGFFSPAAQQRSWHSFWPNEIMYGIEYDLEGEDFEGVGVELLVGFQKKLKIGSSCQINLYNTIAIKSSNLAQETGVKIKAGVTTGFSVDKNKKTHMLLDTEFNHSSTFDGSSSSIDQRVRFERKRGGVAIGFSIPLNTDTRQGRYSAGESDDPDRDAIGTLRFTYRLVKKKK